MSLSECGKPVPQGTTLVHYGQETKVGEYPWQAAIYKLKNGEWRFACGGSLIKDEKTVLTGMYFRFFQYLMLFRIIKEGSVSHERWTQNLIIDGKC